MKIWQTYLLVSAVIAAPHLNMHFALGMAAGWLVSAFWMSWKAD